MAAAHVNLKKLPQKILQTPEKIFPYSYRVRASSWGERKFCIESFLFYMLLKIFLTYVINDIKQWDPWFCF